LILLVLELVHLHPSFCRQYALQQIEEKKKRELQSARKEKRDAIKKLISSTNSTVSGDDNNYHENDTDVNTFQHKDLVVTTSVTPLDINETLPKSIPSFRVRNIKKETENNTSTTTTTTSVSGNDSSKHTGSLAAILGGSSEKTGIKRKRDNSWSKTKMKKDRKVKRREVKKKRKLYHDSDKNS